MTARDYVMTRFLPYTFEVWSEDNVWYLCVMDRDYCCMWITPLKRKPLWRTLEHATCNGDMRRDGVRTGGKQGWLYDSHPPGESEIGWKEYIDRLNVLMSLRADMNRIDRTGAGSTARHRWTHKAWHEALGLNSPGG